MSTAVPTTSVSLSAIASVFAPTKSAPHKLSQFYEGGGYIKSADTQPYDVPTSGVVSIGQFRGGVKNWWTDVTSMRARISFDNNTVVDETGTYAVTSSAGLSYTGGNPRRNAGRSVVISGNSLGFTPAPVSYIDMSGPTLTTANGFTLAFWVYVTTNPIAAGL